MGWGHKLIRKYASKHTRAKLGVSYELPKKDSGTTQIKVKFLKFFAALREEVTDLCPQVQVEDQGKSECDNGKANRRFQIPSLTPTERSSTKDLSSLEAGLRDSMGNGALPSTSQTCLEDEKEDACEHPPQHLLMTGAGQ